MPFPIEIIEKGVDWPAWSQAIGSLAAIGFAVQSLISVHKQRSDAEHTKVYVAEKTARYFHAFLLQAERDLGGGHGGTIEPLFLTSHQAQRFLEDGLFREVLDAAYRLPPAELPTAELADAWFTLRITVRNFEGRCRNQAAVPGSASTINFDEFWPGSQAAWKVLQPAVQRLRRPFTPIWLQDYRRRRIAKARAKAVAKANA